MKSKVVPEDSYGDDFARVTYGYIVKHLKIDPITEGRTMERKIYNILNPVNITEFVDASVREEARVRADRIVETYIARAKKFWRIYQLYTYNRGQQRAVTILNPWLKNGAAVKKRLRGEQRQIINDEFATG